VLISFCIPAHNEAQHLTPTISAIRAAADGLEHEIIVADDASTDATPEIAAGAGAHVVRIERRQIAASRNAAARAAKGDVLFFVDADTLASTEAVREALEELRRGVAGGGAPVRFDGEIPRFARISLPLVLWLFRLLRVTGGAFMFCTRSAYVSTGGWDETLFASEEIEFAKSIKRHGRFVVLRTTVVTSGRKLRTHTAGELIRTLAKATFTGGRSLRKREGLDVWYGPRREDTGAMK